MIRFVELDGFTVTEVWACGAREAKTFTTADEARSHAARVAADEGTYVLDKAQQVFLAW